MDLKYPIRCGVLVVSDRCFRKEMLDESGPAVVELLRSAKSLSASVEITLCVPDEQDAIKAALISWTDVFALDLVITSGGTGFGVRDVTPEVCFLLVLSSAPPPFHHTPSHTAETQMQAYPGDLRNCVRFLRK